VPIVPCPAFRAGTPPDLSAHRPVSGIPPGHPPDLSAHRPASGIPCGHPARSKCPSSRVRHSARAPRPI